MQKLYNNSKGVLQKQENCQVTEQYAIRPRQKKKEKRKTIP